MENLPDDCIHIILSFLKIRDLRNICNASKTFEISRVCRSNRIWKSRYKALRSDPLNRGALNEDQIKKVDSIASDFEKFRFVESVIAKNITFRFSEKAGFWLPENLIHIFYQDEIDFRGEYRDIKVVFTGDNGVGKTSVLIRECKDKFVVKPYLPTYFDNKVAKVRFKNMVIGLNLWDSVLGDTFEDLDTLRPTTRMDTDCYVFVYDICNRESFENIHKKWFDFSKNYDSDSNCVVIANKFDLISSSSKEQLDEENVVSRREGLQLAMKIGAFGYLEVSAKTGHNITTNKIRSGEESDIFPMDNMIIYSYILSKCTPKKYDHKEIKKLRRKENKSSKCRIM